VIWGRAIKWIKICNNTWYVWIKWDWWYMCNTKADFEKKAESFSRKLFEYKLNYNSTFKANYNKEIQRQKEKWINVSDVAEWLKEWPVIATKDYVVWHKEQIEGTFNELRKLEFDDMLNWLDNIWWTITSPQETLSKIEERAKEEIEDIKEMWEIVINIDDVVIPENDYEKWYDTWYAWTTVVLENIPTWKVLKIFWKWKDSDSIVELKRLNKERKDKDNEKKLEKKFQDWLNKWNKDTIVYIWYNPEWKATYVGITNDIATRQYQHTRNGKNINIQPIPWASNLTRNQARSIEQNIIENNKIDYDENKINSIAVWRDIYTRAVKWWKKSMIKKGIKFTWY